MKHKICAAIALSAITYLFLPPADLSRIETLSILFLNFCGFMILFWKAEEIKEQREKRRSGGKPRKKHAAPQIIDLSEKHYYKLREIS